MTRRMIGPPEWVSGGHQVEHDWDEDCDNSPRCRDLTDYQVPAATVNSPYDSPPGHYEGGNGVQPWDIIDGFGLDFYLGNVMKYVCRAGKKDGAAKLDDLKKARNYISKAIELEEGER